MVDMNLRTYVLVIVLLALVCSRVLGLTLSDGDPGLKDDDARLDQKITCSADGMRIADVIAWLQDTTGVTMTAGVDKDDWMVQDRKVIVQETDMKLGDLMRELGSILKFHWSRGGEKGKWTYRLWQDKASWIEEDSLRSKAGDAQAKQAREKRENAIADIVNLSSLSASDSAALRASDPWRFLLATEPLGRDVAEFINSFPEARNAIAQGVEAGFPVSRLSPQLQDTVRRIARSYDALAKSIGASEDHSDLLNGFDRLQITVNGGSLGGVNDVVSKSMIGRITVGNGFSSLDIPLFEPSSPVARALGSAILSLRSGGSKDEVGKRLQTDLASVAKASQPRASTRDISSDPALREVVQVFKEPTNASLAMTLKALGEKTKLNIISDYFPGPPVTVSDAKKSLGEQLETIRTAYGTNWTKAGSVLRFNDIQWFEKRAWEVPQVWIEYWIARGKKNDGLNLDDLNQIGNLRDEQIDHTIMTNVQLVGLGAGDAARNRQILRFYALLTDDQIKQLTAQSLSASALSDAQWSALQKALATQGAAYAAVEKGSQMIRLSKISSGDIEDYKFSIYPAQNEPPVVFKLTKAVAFKAGDEPGFKDRKRVEAGK